jgi:hypothetical protein
MPKVSYFSWGALSAAIALSLLRPGLAWGQVIQPDGTPIPKGTAAQTYINKAEGIPNAINGLLDARLIPETFDPRCNLTFTVLARGGGFKNTFGWYNVVSDPNNPGQTLKPPDSDLHAFLLCSDAVGVSKVFNIRNDPHYQGGLIGFFLATPQDTGGGPGGKGANCPTFNADGGPVAGTVGYVYYTERKYNPDNLPSQDSFIHLLIWQSVAFEDSFYFGWEDLYAGGDNDFEDFLTRVDGIACAGSGKACFTGQLGICGSGTEQCQKGELTCIQDQQARAETCNALDDDCNGTVDEGNVCEPGEVCDKGKCVPHCAGGEFTCFPGFECIESGLCVEKSCIGVECPVETRCRDGECVSACGGVVCPYGQKCVGGTCLDPCTNVVCDSGFVCVQGVCQHCECCNTGLVCRDNVCTEAACATVSCAAGQHCEAGQCLDNCSGVVCPEGQVCEDGRCLAQAIAISEDGGIVIITVPEPEPEPQPGSGGTTGTAGAGGTQGRAVTDDSTCACRAAGAGPLSRFGALALGASALLAAAGIYRRKRR